MLSADPAMEEYLPSAGKGADGLPGMGGVYNSTNLVTYHYAGNNPLKYVDPNGYFTDYSKMVDSASDNTFQDSQFKHPTRGLIYAQRKDYLMEVKDSTRGNPIYQRNAGGPFHRAPSKDLTWCNQGAFDVSQATGIHITALLGKKSRWDSNANVASRSMSIIANSPVSFLYNLGIKAPGEQLHELTPENAQKMANFGYTVVSAWENPDGIGHLGTVRPNDGKFDPAKGPLISNIGWKNYIRYAIEAYGVGGRGGPKKLSDIHYYFDPNQTFEYDPSKANREF